MINNHKLSGTYFLHTKEIRNHISLELCRLAIEFSFPHGDFFRLPVSSGDIRIRMWETEERGLDDFDHNK